MTQTLELTSWEIMERVESIALEKLKILYPYLVVDSETCSFDCCDMRTFVEIAIPTIGRLYELYFDYIAHDKEFSIYLHNIFESDILEKYRLGNSYYNSRFEGFYLDEYPTVEMFDKKVTHIVDTMCKKIGKDTPMINEMLTLLQKIHKLFDNLNLPPGLKCEDYKKQLDIINLHLESKKDSEHYKQTAENYAERKKLLSNNAGENQTRDEVSDVQ